MLRSLCLPLLILACAGVLVFKAKMGKVKEAVISEQEAEKWFSEQELSLFAKKLVVEARTIARDDEGEEIQTWMKIEHVFHGPDFLKGQQFLVVSSKELPWSPLFEIYPAPHVDAVGIWHLQVHKNRLLARPRCPLVAFGVAIPAFQKDGDDYKTALSFSKAVEEVSQLPDRQKQLSRLKQLVLSQESEIAHWATGVLGREKPDGIVDFLRGVIASEKSTVAAQVVADMALMELDRKGWQHSNERIAMVKNWVHGKSSLRAALMSDGLSGMRHESFGIDKKKLLNFLSVAILNEELPPDERLGIVYGFRDYSKQFKNDESFQDEVFQVFANVVLKSKDQAVKLKAAQTLATEFSLESKTRQTLLRKLMESEDSGEGGRFLREHLDEDEIQ